MRFILLCLAILILVPIAHGQKPDDVIATAKGFTFRVSDLSPETQKDIADLPARIPQARSALLDKLVSQRLFTIEAKARGTTVGKMLAAEKAKVKDPTEAEIALVIEANRSALAGMKPDEARRQVVAYLRNAPEQKALGELFASLKLKHKYVAGKDVNAAGLALAETVATVAGVPITAKEFEDFVRVPLYEARAELADVVTEELDERIYSALVLAEAKALAIDSGELVSREVTSKMKDYSNAERAALEDAFRRKLYAKYDVKLLYPEPVAPRQSISVDDDPSIGPAAAPVTIVMFSDFQCSACAATHPLLKEVIAAYPDRIRFVVRDFPLESIHADAFAAARAASAARAQGKFFEYIEILYRSQNEQDEKSLLKYAAELGLNVKQFELDFNSAAVAAEIRKDLEDGESYGVNSTPTIFVNGTRVRNLSLGGFKSAIERALAVK